VDDIGIIIGLASVATALVSTGILWLQSRAFDRKYGIKPDDR
jgi:hypothetical protein